MEKLYDRIFFENNNVPALNDTNLNAMSKALDDIDNRVLLLGDDVLIYLPQIKTYLDQAEDLVEALELLSQNPPYIGANGNWWVWDTSVSDFVDSGVDASITVRIADITMLDYEDAPNVTNTGTDTDPIFHLFLPRAATIESIEKTSTVGSVDTYTITMQDGATFTFTVRNGDGIGDMLADDYDPQGSVVNAGGIEDYVDGVLPTVNDATLTIKKNGTTVTEFSANDDTNKEVNIVTDDWIASATVAPTGTVSFSNIDDTDNRAYDVWFDIDDNSLNKNPIKNLSSLSGAGTNNMSVTYKTDADVGSTAWLRVIR